MGAPLGVLVGAAVHVETPVLILVVMDVRTPAQKDAVVAEKHVPRHAQGTAEGCHWVHSKGKVTITMNPEPTELMNTPDFWLLLLCYEFMGEEKFREILESIEKVSNGENIDGRE